MTPVTSPAYTHIMFCTISLKTALNPNITLDDALIRKN